MLTLVVCSFFWSGQQFFLWDQALLSPLSTSPLDGPLRNEAFPFRFSHNELGFQSLATTQLCWFSPILDLNPRPQPHLTHDLHIPASLTLFLLFSLPDILSPVNLVLPNAAPALGPWVHQRPWALAEPRGRKWALESETCGFTPAPPPSSVTFDLLLNCSRPQFIHLAHGNSNTNYTGFLSTLNTLIHEKCQVHSGCLIMAG